MRRVAIIAVCLVVAVASLGGAWWYYANVYSDVQVASEPVPSATWRATAPVETNPPGGQPTEAPTDLPDNPRGEPVQLVLYRGTDVIISMKFGPMVTTPRGWSSQCGKVAWKSSGEWPMPGFASNSRSLITGHVWCQRETYPLDHLREVRKGDRAEVYYSSGDVAVGEAEQDADSIPKDQLNAETEGKRNPALHNPHKMRTLRVTTCDSESEYRPDGHLSRNTYVLYRVTEILYAAG